jgi:AcrR family transcriptional regulator
MSQTIKDKILEQTEKLFHKYGVRSVSMDDIARNLSISKKTIYQYFKDKDELVVMVSQAHVDRDKMEFREVISLATNAIDEMFRLSSCIRHHISDMNPSRLFDLQKFHPKAWQIWLSYKNEFIRNTIYDVINRGKKEGYFRANLDADILAIFRVESVEMSFDDQIFPHSKFNFTEVQMMLFDHFVHGLMTVKGLELYESLLNSNKNEI